MIFGLSRDAFKTAIAEEVTRQRLEQASREAKEARELVLELRSVLEQLNLVAAREAKRRMRAAKKALNGDQDEQATQVQAEPSVAERKAQLRTRIFGGGHRRAGPPSAAAGEA